MNTAFVMQEIFVLVNIIRNDNYIIISTSNETDGNWSELMDKL